MTNVTGAVPAWVLLMPPLLCIALYLRIDWGDLLYRRIANHRGLSAKLPESSLGRWLVRHEAALALLPYCLLCLGLWLMLAPRDGLAVMFGSGEAVLAAAVTLYVAIQVSLFHQALKR